MDFTELLKVLFFGIVEGITEWLPISSTGHMIILEKIMPLDVTPAFMEMFRVVIQLGAILAVVMVYWERLMPVRFEGGAQLKPGALSMWGKILAACIPAALVGVLFDDKIDALFYNGVTVALALIVFGAAFIMIENRNRGTRPKVNSIAALTYRDAMIIGGFQLIAAVFPGTSRSGATILGAILIGVSRTAAAEFTFFLAVPVMLGASLLKLLKFGADFTAAESTALLAGTITAFLVSVAAIKFLMGYIKKHDFKPFGWYRIVLGALVLLITAVT
ncbi:MAG: undecaprenyl-diphosphate phosphatase [Oscillospiraceae bacterium]